MQERSPGEEENLLMPLVSTGEGAHKEVLLMHRKKMRQRGVL